MSQITIYLPDDVEREVRRAARRARVSVSAFLAGLARKLVSPERWPSRFDRLYGSWEGEFPVAADPPPEDVGAL